MLIAIVTWVLAAAIGARPVQADNQPAPQDLGSLQRELQQDQAKLVALDNQVESTQGQLDNMNRKLGEDQARERDLNRQLSSLARLDYERPSFGLTTVLDARSLDQLMAEIAQSRLVARKQAELKRQADDLRRRDQETRDETTRKLSVVKSARQQASQIATQALDARDKALSRQQNSTLWGEAQEIASIAIAIATPPGSTASDHFPFGQCTYYVATRRDVPWNGNAIDWWQNARPYGRPEGSTPQVGAIMVTRESGYGHVAYVEAVNDDGSWTVTEMNYLGWGRVDQRTIKPGFGYLVGFIY